jgi:hypothetical protein
MIKKTEFSIIETIQLLRVVRNEARQYKRDVLEQLKQVNAEVGNIIRIYNEVVVKELEESIWRFWLR